MTRTFDKYDHECSECMQSFLPTDERECKTFQGESPQAWVVERGSGVKTLWALRAFSRLGPVTWVDDFENGSGFRDFEEATEIAEAAKTEFHDTVRVIPLTHTMLKELARKVEDAKKKGECAEEKNREADARADGPAVKSPFPGALMIEMDASRSERTVSELLGLLGAVFGGLDPKSAPKPKPKFDLAVADWLKQDKAEVRAEIIARMEKMFDEVDELGVMSMHCGDTKPSIALALIRRSLCKILFGVDYADPRIDVGAVNARLKKAALAKVKARLNPKAPPEEPKAPGAPAPVPVFENPFTPLKNVYRVTYNRPCVGDDGDDVVERDYGLIKASGPADAIQIVVDKEHPYMPAATGSEAPNAIIASRRSQLRSYLKAVVEECFSVRGV